MPVYWFWGEDDFSMEQATRRLQQEVLSPDWRAFNYEQIAGDREQALTDALNQALTPPFGSGGRLVWLSEPNLTNTPAVIAELERTLHVLPTQTVLLLTSRKKPDGRSKAVKLLQKYGRSREFALLPPWETDEIFRRVQDAARDLDVALTVAAAELIAAAVGNDTRQLWSELTKLQLFAQDQEQPLEAAQVAALVTTHNQTSLQLAATIRDGDTSTALQLVTDLLNRNEAALAITASLINQFRTWLLLKLALESGEKDERAIAAQAEVRNPRRIYHLRREIRHLSSTQLLATLPLLLSLDESLKQGAAPVAALQAKVVELCGVCQPNAASRRSR
ncbi:MAG: DNA polymerase III subunit delta [Spirulinaceae cyanobacterium RM2_2_10]|nr:DNA polymerase III subunit delta [Spirulinaceae cyanobacterium SM2_1_0]NJO19761.1 DNA polymerase III subunit delta [Spirulinaceae cyanobacterium RM2_2_10]